MRVWPVRRPTHAPATAIRINATAPPTVIPEFSGAAPAVTENIRNLPRQRAGTPWGKQIPPEILSHALLWSTHAPATAPSPTATAPQKPKPLVLPVHRRHACLAGPPANTCSRNCHQNKRNSASHRHSGIFRRGASRDGKYPESPAPAGRNSMGKQIPPEILSHALLWSTHAPATAPSPTAKESPPSSFQNFHSANAK